MRILIGAVGLALLAGCVSTADLEKNAPTISAATKKDPRQYAHCVFPKWQSARSESAMAETVDGYRVWVTNGSLTDELLDIKRTASGSAVVLRQRMAWVSGIGRSEIENATRACL